VPVDHDAPRPTVVAQWDGEAYHRVASWTASAAMGIKHIPYDPRWPFVYAQDGVLFELQDAFVAGDGIVVREPVELVPPTIDSTPPTEAALDVAVDYVATATGDEPRWWSLLGGPALARIDPGTGAIAWTPTEPGMHVFVVRVDNCVGFDEQAFEVEIPGVGGSDGSSGGTQSTSGDDSTGTGGASSLGDGTSITNGDGTGAATSGSGSTRGGNGDGCGCRSTAGQRGVFALLPLLAIARRRRARPATSRP
jgi:hypothetical protein